VETLEGDLTPVECVRDKALCERSGLCPTREIWFRLTESITQSLKVVSLQDIVDRFRSKTRETEIDFCI